MTKEIKFAMDKIATGDFSEVEKYTKNVLGKMGDEGDKAQFAPFQVVKAMSTNQAWRDEFTRSFNLHYFGSANKGVQFDVVKTNVDTVTETDVVPTIEGLIRDTGVLSRIDIQTVAPNASKQIWDFGVEIDAEDLTEVQPGTSADDTIRKGDVLISQNKIQASERISEYALQTLDASEFGMFMARLARRTQYRVIRNVLYSGDGVANGTARNRIRGIKNNFGINGTGDATSTIGAITYASKAAADTALGSASADAYDLCVKVKSILLPDNFSEEEEAAYVYIMNRTTWGRVKTVIDLNGRYKARNAFDPATGKVVREIDGNEVVISPAVGANEVFLVPLAWYKLITHSGFVSLNDGGVVSLREGITVFVNRIWADGTLRYGQKYLAGTAVTVGTTPVDNNAQNAWRVFVIV